MGASAFVGFVVAQKSKLTKLGKTIDDGISELVEENISKLIKQTMASVSK